MLPKGNIWQQLRQQALSAVPDGSSCPLNSTSGLRAWGKTGSFHATSTTSDEVTLDADSQEVGSALVSDAAYLLDHAVEHESLLYRESMAKNKSSPAWLLVSVYYWALFNALAFTRLLGKSVWFVDPATAQILRGEVGSTFGGVVNVTVLPATTATRAQVTLKKSRNRFHEAMWTRLHDVLNPGQLPTRKNDEMLLYSTLHTVGNKLSPEWPSSLRNLVNYRPGHGYRMVRRDTKLDVQKYARQYSKSPLADVASRLTHNSGFITRKKLADVESQRAAGRLLVDISFVLAALARELHSEVSDRRNLPSRWAQQRRRFLSSQSLLTDEGEGPFSGQSS